MRSETLIATKNRNLSWTAAVFRKDKQGRALCPKTRQESHEALVQGVSIGLSCGARWAYGACLPVPPVSEGIDEGRT